MNHHPTRASARSPRRSAAVGLGFALAFGLGACSGGTVLPTGSAVPTVPSSVVIVLPTMPDASDMTACLDANTRALLDQIRSTPADAPALIATNKDAIIDALGELESDDPAVNSWRDSMVTALENADTTNLLILINRFRSGEVMIASC